MCLNGSSKELISNLKGRISRALSVSKQLEDKEIKSLEGLFNIIDEIILHDPVFSDKEVNDYKSKLLKTLSPISKSNKMYIQEHIIPLVNKVSTSKWRG